MSGLEHYLQFLLKCPTTTATMPNLLSLQKALDRYNMLIRSIQDICRSWEVVMKKLPLSVQRVHFEASIPPCSASLHRDVEESLERMAVTARGRAHGLAWSCRLIRTTASGVVT